MPSPLSVHDLDPGCELLLFYGHRGDGVGRHCLSQWYPSRFFHDGVAYSSAEQFMMAAKARLFGDDSAFAAIVATDDPARAKSLGRRVRNFDPAVWDSRCFDIVTYGNLLKFSQSSSLRRYLLSTKPAVLVEASPRDTIWGIGRGASDPLARDPQSWRGGNLLGFALTRVRSLLEDL